jgi:integrase
MSAHELGRQSEPLRYLPPVVAAAAGERINDIEKGFVRACAAAGIDNLTFHDLRHTWATRAADCGVEEHVLLP